ncbi:integral membrane protein [Aulographum hederae CBS 113979]|uniref:Integral membrane protein n=1 Tax=Aulographum hederae CBS 113979 TaxID=1176131 RepID=A0A6G1GX56_9PEZI|nr:integral membrane protein [Aulographum hederae CBS 113979]
MSRTSTESISLVPITYPESVALPPSGESALSLNRTVSKGEQLDEISKSRTAIVVASVTFITGISSLLAGLVTVGTPTIARDIGLDSSLLLWPASIFSLTCGCTLLLCGSIADVLGARWMYLAGTLLQSIFTLACGLSQNGMQLIVFRAFAGIAISFCLPASVSIITHTFPVGKRRNVAFAAMGGGQPIGFSIGLTLGGVFADTVGWRWGFHIAAILNTLVFGLALWGLPKKIDEDAPVTWSRLLYEIDWIGALLATCSLAMISYCFATITSSTDNIKNPSTIVTLTLSLALIPLFIYWVGRQERLSRPAIIPNSLWRNKVFTSICINVFITWGAFNALENELTFFLQYVKGISAIETSVQFLPGPISGALTNIAMGLIVHRIRADYTILIATAVSSVAPLLMALVNPAWTYWSCTFLAIFLNPIGADCLFTISNLLITSVFPGKTQGLAGGVFNTLAQIGKSVGLATTAVIAASVTAQSGEDVDSPKGLMTGYRAAFWYCFGLSGLTFAVSLWGLRNIGRVGVKRD